MTASVDVRSRWFVTRFDGSRAGNTFFRDTDTIGRPRRPKSFVFRRHWGELKTEGSILPGVGISAIPSFFGTPEGPISGMILVPSWMGVGSLDVRPECESAALYHLLKNHESCNISTGVVLMSSQDVVFPDRGPVDPPPAPKLIPTRDAPGLPFLTSFLVVVLALLGGGVAWLAGEIMLDYFRPSREAAAQAYDFQALGREMARASAKNGAVAFGALGGLLGAALGLAGGVARRSGIASLVGIFAGLILGALAGALPAFVIMPWYWQHRNDELVMTSLTVPLLIHSGLWSGAGLAAGLAFGIGAGFKRSRLIGVVLAGLAGAVVGTIVFEFLGGLLFPMARTVEPFSATPGTRLLARICVAGFIGLGTIVSLTGNRPSVARSDPD